MRPRRAAAVAFVFAAGLGLALPAKADFCARMPRWAEASCQALELLFGPGAAPAAQPAGRFEAAPAEAGPVTDPFGRPSAVAPPLPGEEPAEGPSIPPWG